MRGNFLDVPTDCPQRDERMGWTGDTQVFSATACYLADTYAFYKKYLFDLYQEQKDLNGMVPETVPVYGQTKCSCAWGDAVEYRLVQCLCIFKAIHTCCKYALNI